MEARALEEILQVCMRYNLDIGICLLKNIDNNVQHLSILPALPIARISKISVTPRPILHQSSLGKHYHFTKTPTSTKSTKTVLVIELVLSLPYFEDPNLSLVDERVSLSSIKMQQDPALVL